MSMPKMKGIWSASRDFEGQIVTTGSIREVKAHFEGLGNGCRKKSCWNSPTPPIPVRLAPDMLANPRIQSTSKRGIWRQETGFSATKAPPCCLIRSEGDGGTILFPAPMCRLVGHVFTDCRDS